MCLAWLWAGSAAAVPTDPAGDAPADAGELALPAPALEAAPSAAVEQAPTPPVLGRAELAPPPDPDPVSPLDAVPPMLGSSLGCGAVGAPLAACGVTSTAVGTGGILSIFALGANPVVGLLLFAGAFCLGVPSLFLLGPCSAAAAGTGAMIATRQYRDRSAWPALLATMPAVLLALAGSTIAFVGTFFFLGALLGLDPGQIRATGALIALGVVSSFAAGPVAVMSAVGADLLFGGPLPDAGTYDDVLDDGGVSPPTTPPLRRPSPTTSRRPQAPRVAMAF